MQVYIIHVHVYMVCLAVNQHMVKNLKMQEMFPERVANQVKKQVHSHKMHV